MGAEMQFHLEAYTADLVRAGLSREAAARRARAEFGGREALKEACRESRGLRLFDELRQDLTYAARLLRRNPLFALTAALSLAIGIGANTTVFTVANRLLFRAAAGVADPNRLVDIGTTREDGRFTNPVVPYPVYDFVRERVTTLEAVYGYQLEPRAMSLMAEQGAARSDRVFATPVTPNYFTVLGIRPAAGRLFDEHDVDRADGSPLVVLSHRFWVEYFSSD